MTFFQENFQENSLSMKLLLPFLYSILFHLGVQKDARKFVSLNVKSSNFYLPFHYPKILIFLALIFKINAV